MTQKKIFPESSSGGLLFVQDFPWLRQMGPYLLCLAAMLTLASFTVSYEWGPDPRAYGLGEIAETDILADHSFRVQDQETTRSRREAAQKAQPLICALNAESVDAMHERLRNWFLQAGRLEANPLGMEALRLEISEAVNEEVGPRAVELMANQDFQNLVNNIMLPWAEQRLRAGIVPDTRKLAPYGGSGVLIRDLKTGQETLLPDSHGIQDINDFQLELEREARTLSTGLQSKKLLILLLGNLAESTLTLNEEATLQRGQEAAKAVRPVVRQITAGEIIVRQGDQIDAETLNKLNALWRRSADRFKPQLFIGALIFSLIACLGLFYSPSRRKASPVEGKDIVFIGALALFMTFFAKFFYLIGLAFSASFLSFTLGAQAFAVPVAGAAGLGSLTLNKRRYFTISLLLSFFCTLVGKGGVPLFMFYFVGCLFCTWLINDSQNRKDVLLALFPLGVGLAALWLGAAFLRGGDVGSLPAEALAMLMGAVLSILIIFALSPLAEITFGFTTRFVLMELLNQEHPLLRQLMLEAPGTYHHSIIVANMVEPAAKAIGAHSLLCKVGAMYHDIGKTDKSEYFIENQFNSVNPHERLTPAMSALVLVSHVKRGAEMAQQYKLGREVADIIVQHHGSSLIRYFYHKASLLNPGTRQEDFSYAGPRPQSREAALIMLADVVEASSRTLEDPTPSRIKMHVRKIIQGVLAEGQLDNTDMTFKDLDQVMESFTLILTGIFHKRIEYPSKVPSKPGIEKNPDQAETNPLNDDSAGTEAQNMQWIMRKEERGRHGKRLTPAQKPHAAKSRPVKMPVHRKRTPEKTPSDAASIM
ncbi:MAG: HDIG domain-containing protein [Deltaproteobacteria bacterium]|jgi:putative nucleotidyltransferase with HDIG domain|nr:HDIG domain-containing protein [Deltaproteobacteria bacterium]